MKRCNAPNPRRAIVLHCYVILCSAVLVQYWRVTDRRTDGHTTTARTALA